MRKDAIDAIRAAEPYAGGKGADFWTLHRLNNIDKHRLLIAVASSYEAVDIGGQMVARLAKALGEGGPKMAAAFGDLSIPLKPADNLYPLKTGNTLFTDAADAEPDDKVKFKIQISLHEPGVLETGPLLETVQHLSDLVSKTLRSFKPLLA